MDDIVNDVAQAQRAAAHTSPPGSYNRFISYNSFVKTRAKTATRRSRIKPVRQSVTIPAPLVAEVRRVAKERHVTMSRALVSLAEDGVRAELAAKENLKSTCKRFMDQQEPALKNAAGKDLVRAIFGKGAIAEDTVL